LPKLSSECRCEGINALFELFWYKFFRGLPIAWCIEVRVIVIIFTTSINASIVQILPQAIDGFFDLLVCGEHWPWTELESKAKEGLEIKRGLCVCVSGKIVCGHV